MIVPDVVKLFELPEESNPMFPELSIHIVASIENPSWLEYMGWYDHLWQEPLKPENGMLKPTSRPGHGMDFKPEICTF